MALCLSAAFLQFKTIALCARDYTECQNEYNEYPIEFYLKYVKDSKLRYLKAVNVCMVYVSLAAFFFIS